MQTYGFMSEEFLLNYFLPYKITAILMCVQKTFVKCSETFAY